MKSEGNGRSRLTDAHDEGAARAGGDVLALAELGARDLEAVAARAREVEDLQQRISDPQGTKGMVAAHLLVVVPSEIFNLELVVCGAESAAVRKRGSRAYSTIPSVLVVPAMRVVSGQRTFSAAPPAKHPESGRSPTTLVLLAVWTTGSPSLTFAGSRMIFFIC